MGRKEAWKARCSQSCRPTLFYLVRHDDVGVLSVAIDGSSGRIVEAQKKLKEVKRVDEMEI